MLTVTIADLVPKILAMDQDLGTEFILAWKRQRSVPGGSLARKFSSLDDYLAVRYDDSAGK